ncbi:addiction module toxin, RelE/StbE family [mine drainage metagenome]|uniref:Addiction module toxin, RelE/StbE family n=1 Tax=mine drainage metagenome TaxID=410659 RepID=T0YEM3_9ZZZZ
MAFHVELSELAAERLRKLDGSLRDRIVRKLEQAAKEPSRFLERLSAVESYKLRVGDHRIIIDVDWKAETLYVLTLGHRSVVYR